MKTQEYTQEINQNINQEIIKDDNLEIEQNINQESIQEDTQDFNTIEQQECLALAVRKEHRLMVIRKISKTTIRMSWKHLPFDHGAVHVSGYGEQEGTGR